MNRLMKIICGRQRCEEELDIFNEERELVVQDRYKRGGNLGYFGI